MSEATTELEQKTEPAVQKQESIKDVLESFNAKPPQEQIEQWKSIHGEVFVSGFTETDLYIWRPLSRPEYRKLQEATQAAQGQIDQFKYEEMVCEMCVLWKSDSRPWAVSKAGTCMTLHEQIMQNSNFVTPAAAAMLVSKL